MKTHETLSKGEQMLARVLEECLEEDISFVPPEREIARTHRFSEKFEAAMEKLLEHSSHEIRKKEIRRHFSPRYGQWAACILIFCICSGLFYYCVQPTMDKSTVTEGSMEEAEYENGSDSIESFDAASSEAAAEAEPAEAETPQMTTEEQRDEADSKKQDTGAGLRTERIYCGKTVYLAEQQEVPEALEHVATLVNCPVLDEENPVLFLTIGNTGEEEVKYLDQYTLEVWLEDGWYVIPPKEEKQGEWILLAPGMAVDEEIDLAAYQMDYGAQRYRLITQIGENLVSAEFTFEEAFTETMEKLEEENSGE